MKLIIVEDDNDQIISYQDAIAVLNAAGGEQITPTIVRTLTDAQTAINSESFDAAIVDLKLSGNQDETEGNEVIRQIVNLKRFPVFVYSSFLGDIDPAIEQSFFFQKFERTAITFQDVASRLKDICKTGITKILGRGGIIEEHLTKIFWKHIAESFEDLCQKGITEDQLLRYITGHLYEYLEIGEKDGAFKSYLPEEVYIKPSIKPHFFTGSIVKEKTSEKKFIILTPACDIANSKADHILLASVSDLTGDPVRSMKSQALNPVNSSFRGDRKKKAEDAKKNAEIQLENILKNRGPHKYYFLPKSKNFCGGLINFQDLESADPGTMNDRFEIIATVNSPFLKDIVARFSFYYSRQGAPETTFSISDLP